MRNMFNSDSSFSKIMNKIADWFILNILWIFCSIPIVTIGATTTALYSVNLKIINNEEGNLIKTFFKSFKENFKKSTIICYIFLFTYFFISHSIYIPNINKN